MVRELAEARQAVSTGTFARIQWLSDLVRLEIGLWNRIDAKLRVEHGLPLAYFESLYFIGHSLDRSLRVGELAAAV